MGETSLESRTKRAASCWICCVNLQVLSSSNTLASSRTWLSWRGDNNVPSCIVPAFQRCKVRPSQGLQSVPSGGGRRRDSRKHMPGQPCCLTHARCEGRVKAAAKLCLHSLAGSQGNVWVSDEDYMTPSLVSLFFICSFWLTSLRRQELMISLLGVFVVWNSYVKANAASCRCITKSLL